MALSITGNCILDLVSIQTMSILYLSEAVISLVKWKDVDDPLISNLITPPSVGWYEKAAGTGIKSISKLAKPCMKTTGFSIQTLSRLADILPKYQIDTYLAEPSLHNNWKTTADLQLQFCLEYLETNTFSVMDSSSVLEGGVCFLKSTQSMKGLKNFQSDLNKVYLNIYENLKCTQTSTMDIAFTIRGLAAWNEYYSNQQRDDLITALILEVLDRKSQSGLFHYGPYGHTSVPMGQQFFILDALLRAYPYVQLDYVLEQIFNIFSQLYQIAYKDAYQMFAFKKKNISYTNFEIGALLSCLKQISFYSDKSSEQISMLNQLIDTFLEFLTQNYMEYHELEIIKLLKWVYFSHECKARIEDRPNINTILPKRIYLNISEPRISWDRKGIINQGHIFFLCSILLSLLEENPKTQRNIHSNFEFPVLDTLNMLYSLLGAKQ